MVLGSSRQNQKKHRPFVIPIFLPHAGCPHQCIFCNQDSITGIKEKSITAQKFQTLVEAFLEYNAKQRRPVEIAFFGGNFLGQTTAVVQKLLTEAAKFVYQGRADSIRFSTRPDTIDRRRLEIISAFPVSTVELGVQSMNARVLRTSRRGHSDLDTEHAVGLLKDYHYTIGVQIMIGLPGDDPHKMMQSGQRIVDLKPDFVRIYPTLVLQDSPLAQWYQTGRYRPLSLKTAVTQAKHLWLLFHDAQIPVIRMGLQHSQNFDTPETVLAGPYHPAFGHLVYSEIYLDRTRAAIEAAEVIGERIAAHVNPRDVSKMRGLNNSNIKALKTQYNFNAIDIKPDPALVDGELKVEFIKG